MYPFDRTETFMIVAGAALAALSYSVATRSMAEPKQSPPLPFELHDRMQTVIPWNSDLQQRFIAAYTPAPPVEIAADDVNVESDPLPIVTASQGNSGQVEVERVAVPRAEGGRKRAIKSVRTVSSRSNALICQRHGMRKVMVSKYKWRCRK